MTTSKKGLSSAALHILAMAFMLCDHLWATIFFDQRWLTSIGRIAFPIFAFLIAEGFRRTHDVRQYLKRLLIFAVLSEIPFNLVDSGGFVSPFHQNVLWTFLIAILLMLMVEKAKATGKLWLTVLAAAAAVILGLLIGTVTMVDFFGPGVLTVLVFYFFPKRTWWCLLGQIACLYYLNMEMLGGYCPTITLFGHTFEYVEQGLALLALIPIWLYQGRQGYHEKWFRWFCYAFYPVHLLVLYLLMRFL